MQSRKLTKRVVDAASAEDCSYIIWDVDLSGFGLKVNPTGKKSYLLKYRVGGGRGATVRKPTIGTHGALTLEQARAIAREWMAQIRQGGDPGGERAIKRAAPRMNELLDRYLSDHAEPHKKPKSIAQDRRTIDVHLRPALGQKKVVDLARNDVAALHRRLGETPYQANRTLALLSKAMNLAEGWGMRPDGSNPCRHVKKYREQKRERFLSAQELARLGEALAAAERGDVMIERAGKGGEKAYSSILPQAIAAIRLLVFTGARVSEILSLERAHVNLEAGRLELPDSKTGAKFVYLPAPAKALLAVMPEVENNPYVITGGKPGTHLVNLKDSWGAIRDAADLSDVRIHDLRHSFASIGAAGGMSLPVIGALLGHKDTATTARYAHLSDDPLRAAADAIGGQIADAMVPPCKVVS